MSLPTVVHAEAAFGPDNSVWTTVRGVIAESTTVVIESAIPPSSAFVMQERPAVDSSDSDVTSQSDDSVQFEPLMPASRRVARVFVRYGDYASKKDAKFAIQTTE